jgi:GNAT superfamily N-acetyltransferase
MSEPIFHGWAKAAGHGRFTDRGQARRRALMNAFEDWAGRRGCVLVTLATRRAEPFYVALGYQRSASYLRKVLPDRGQRR